MKFLAFSFVLLSFGSYAQDQPWGTLTSDYNFIGFSNDGAYAAYEMQEELPYSDGKVRAQIFIIDVDKNDYATRVFRFDADSLTMPKYKHVSDSVHNVLNNRFHISGANKGTPIEFKAGVAIDSMTVSYSFTLAAQSGKVIVKEIIVTGGEEYGVPEVMVQVDLVFGGIKKILQSPQRAPKSWGTTNHYALIGGWHFGNKLALFLTYETAAFEGPGTVHQMIVTGKLK